MNNTLEKIRIHRNKRAKAERRFKWYGCAALGFASLALVYLLYTIVIHGYSGFYQAQIALPIHFDKAVIDPQNTGKAEDWASADYMALVRQALKEKFPAVTEREDQHALYELISTAAEGRLREALEKNPAWLDTTQNLWLPASSTADLYYKGQISAATPEQERRLKDNQLSWLDSLQKEGAVKKQFNSEFFTEGDSREPEQAGFLGGIVGSLFTLLVCIAVAFPLGVLTAVYLEEFAPRRRTRMIEIIEVNINNLAAVPSIVFGLLGLAVYLGVFHIPRSAALVGGLTLALMILPVIIITTRVALKAVPPSIREAARALGASPLQVVFHHVVPLALPGIMTGTILGMARAMGETAPLLMIGMVAFVADIPGNFTDPATVMPVQIFLWAGSPEAGFVEKTSAAILVLLVVLAAMNALAIIIRKRYETRW